MATALSAAGGCVTVASLSHMEGRLHVELEFNPSRGTLDERHAAVMAARSAEMDSRSICVVCGDEVRGCSGPLVVPMP
ncbi:MAG: hypothetical protein VR70_11040 [Rhodospirillaceae bacterium BRH_c57]|nr:MAG: hypothetical protein VR70_11040 [Rhodospirillaceae bacterium BRH_c57]